MSRGPRLHAPHSLHHLISRFLNRQYLLCGPAERGHYLRRVTDVLKRTDARPLGYALMSSHVHWACSIGAAPAARFIQPLHGGFAGWLNRHTGRLGPAFAGRFTDVVCPHERAAVLLAYLHNNPVRAGLVRDPAECDWTSHQAYLGIARGPVPPWLDIAAGLSASGFDSSPSGRLHFHEFVLSRAASGRDPLLSDDGAAAQRRRARRESGAPCEVSDATVDPQLGRSRRELVLTPGGVVRPRWPGEPEAVVRRVAAMAGLQAAELASRSRRRDIVEARRVTLWLWTRLLGRVQGEMTAVLGLAASSGSELVRTRPQAAAEVLGGLAEQLWRPYQQMGGPVRDVIAVPLLAS